MKILRVFPKRNSYTPRDALAVIGYPPLPGFLPNGVDEVHVSCTFTSCLPLGAEAHHLQGGRKRLALAVLPT